MTTCTIRGIPVSFPYEPYSIQKDYMEKVIDCLQNEENGVLESPTGTGKTLSLLCSSLAWLTMKKAQMKIQMQSTKLDEANEFIKSLNEDLNKKVGRNSTTGDTFFHLPTIIYASRTHSQLTQAMQELKKTAYSQMKATIIGSREQMCIHPDIIRETHNVSKIHMCRAKVLSKTCHFYNRVERKKDDPAIKELSVVDIEDLVALGKTHKFCPYFMAKELKHESDIVFMPYNYLLDPKAKKALGIELSNNIIILDEAHNVEKMCEESASLQIRSTDIALCIEEVTEIMKVMNEDNIGFLDDNVPRDFIADDLYMIKEMLLNLEKAIDNIEIKSNSELTTFEGNYIFEILAKAGIRDDNFGQFLHLLEKIIYFLSTAGESPFQRKGNNLQLLEDLVRIAFTSTSPDFREKVEKCYKIHISEEEIKKKTVDTWLSKGSTNKKTGRVLSYWCFSPGFGMNMLMKQGIKCIILTSGTLAPLQPLISELELKVNVRLENPHIVSKNQVCVKIISKGPDNEPLNCSYHNRNNPKFIASLGRSVVNLARVIPDGLLIFFPSYPILRQCQEQWQQEGTWSNIHSVKGIYVEPRDKDSFVSTMNDYYAKIQDPNSKGAIFMGVCRGKVSEGLDFADINGRAVIIIGLPYPPMKDPKIILKKSYLDRCNATDKQYLRGDDWYSLEASRAVNQAIGRVIRHKNDYGAILLLDSRFSSWRIKSQMSLWLRDRIELVSNFGTVMRDMKLFFKNAEAAFPLHIQKANKTTEEYQNVSVPAEFDVSNIYKNNLFDFSSSVSSSASNSDNSSNLVTIHKRNLVDLQKSVPKKKKITLVARNSTNDESTNSPLNTTIKEYIIMVQKALEPKDFQAYLKAITVYRQNSNFDELIRTLDEIFSDKSNLLYIIQGLSHYIKEVHKTNFEDYWSKIR